MQQEREEKWKMIEQLAKTRSENINIQTATECEATGKPYTSNKTVPFCKLFIIIIIIILIIIIK